MTKNQILHTAHRTLELQKDAITALSETLNDSFEEAVHMLLSLKNRLIITGVGKSGHIGKKLAATFSSTGTPSFFVHPTEASHGDMGMIKPEDIILAISNSGETKELADILTYARRYSIKLIAITARHNSTLAQHANVVLCLPAMPEAGKLGLAPTTSTLTTLALGDALAISVLEEKDFSEKDFGIFHPGGSLAKKIMTLKDLMHANIEELPLINQKASVSEALIQNIGRHFGCVGVVDEQQNLIGIVSDGDLRRHIKDEKLLSQNITHIMTKDPITAKSDMLAVDAAVLMSKKLISAIFVIQDKKPVGIVHLHDFLQAGLL